ncbi:MAG: phosphoglycerate dehydrogenase [Candidatus Omnitrophota bacterium]
MKILVSDPLSKEGIEILKKEKFEVDEKTKLTPDELKKIIKDYDALIVRSETKVTADIIKASKNLKVIGRAGVGLDNVDATEASKKGIIVMNTPGGNTISAAEHTMSLILALSRNIAQATASMKKGEWNRKKFMGVELYEKTLGVVGLGRIGTEVAKRALSFGMKVIAYDPYLTIDKAKQLEIQLVTLKELFASADYITVHVPLVADTKHLISEKEIKQMKDGVRIINGARGGIIDEAALLDGVKSGKIAGVALDVFEKEPPEESELLKMDNVITTPHLGASTQEAQVNVAIDIAKQVADALLGRGVRNAVNIPYIEPEALKVIQPYINLSEKMGALQSQLAEGRITEVNISYAGEIAKHDVMPVTVAFVKGLLTPVVGEMVNYVNASVLASERGIKVTESKTSSVGEFANLVCAIIKTSEKEVEVSGTLFANGQPRIIRIDGFYVEIEPKGYMLFASNKDVPGIIGQIGTILGKNNINIAAMTFGRKKQGGMAVSVCSVDSAIPEKVLEQIRKADNIYGAKLIKL